VSRLVYLSVYPGRSADIRCPVYGTNGVNWLKPSHVLDARLFNSFKMGVQVDF
jgi:hypothetical protein